MQLLFSADETVKSMFLLSNNRNHLTTRYYRDQMVKEVQRHEQDYGSMEATRKYMLIFMKLMGKTTDISFLALHSAKSLHSGRDYRG